MKKTFVFLDEKGVFYDFIDYKKQVPSADLLRNFLSKTSLESLVNRQGTTYKKLEDAQKEALQQESTALPILMAQPSMIKRPLIEYADGSITLGFVPDQIVAKLK
ncbi:MAG: Spx/MgsR family RNA polymerase-binding regulatory protein [Algoriphagus sp.]|nr:Spx/MgsR family RNA polymerase-binding regulatory protein [Algoriphagus sp.]